MNRSLPGLVPLLEAARTVIYLGSNTNGSACGDFKLFNHLVKRELIDHFGYRYNSLLVYGQSPRTEPIVAEEYAALNQIRMYSLEEARELAALANVIPLPDTTRRVM